MIELSSHYHKQEALSFLSAIIQTSSYRNIHLIHLNKSLYIDFMHAKYLVEWSNHLEDIFKIKGVGHFLPPPPPPPTHTTQLVINKCIYSFTAIMYFYNISDFEYLYAVS